MSTEKTRVLDTVCKKSSNVEEELTPTSPVWEDLIKLRNYFGELPEKVADKYFGTDANKKFVFKDGGGGGGTYTAGDHINISSTNVISAVDFQEELSSAQLAAANSGITSTKVSGYDSHISATNNPHGVTKSQVGLGNVDNTSDANKPISTATQTALNDKADEDDLTAHTSATNNPHSVSKAQVGLGNVDNTSDNDKPISSATQTALDNLQDDVDDKLDKTTGASKIYGTDSSGAQTTYGYSTSAATSSIAMRDNAGRTQVGDPTTNAHAANKQYVDNQVSSEASSRQTADTTLQNNIDTNSDAIDDINNVIPSGATSTNKLADSASVDDKVSTLSGKLLDAVATKAALPTTGINKNDTCTVLADETHSNQCWMYQYDGTAWMAKYKINDTPLTTEQINAINSGITSAKVSAYDGYATGKSDTGHSHNVANITDLTASAAEINYCDGVTSNIQNQLNNKASSSHTHSDATTSNAGFMSTSDKTKLNGIETNANKTVVDSALSSTSTNPVQNKIINSALSGKQASLTNDQLNAVNSGITATAVNKISGLPTTTATLDLTFTLTDGTTQTKTFVVKGA